MPVSPVRLVILLAIPAVLVWFAAQIYRQYRRLRHIPGPRFAGLSKWWIIRATWSGRTHLDYYEACQTYGNVVRISPHDVVTSDIDLVKRILAVRSPYKRSNWYNGLRFNPAENNILSMRDDKVHSILRSKMAAGYSGKDVEKLELKIDNTVLNLIKLIQEYAFASKPLDLTRKVHFLAIDVISELAFGKSFGDLTSDADVHDYIATMEKYLPTLVVSTVISWFIPMLGLPIFRPFLPSEHDVVGVGHITGIAKRVASERFGPEKIVRRDMVGSFVARGLTQAQTESEIAAQLVAGSDTTATAMGATLLHIITNPRVLSQLQQEIAQTPLSRPVARDAEIRTMTYLQAVIKEGLRIFPPITGFMSKEVPADGDTWKGMCFPPGTRIGLCMWGICRNAHVWGTDADQFRPERWLNASPEQRAVMDSTLDLVFGSGKWGCLGRNIAQLELNKVLVELLRRFDFNLVDPTRPWKATSCVVFQLSNLWVRASIRDQSLVLVPTEE